MLCTEGTGWRATRDGARILGQPGTAVWTQPDEELGHGPHEPMTHTATQIGDREDWLDAASDLDYRQNDDNPRTQIS